MTPSRRSFLVGLAALFGAKSVLTVSARAAPPDPAPVAPPRRAQLSNFNDWVTAPGPAHSPLDGCAPRFYAVTKTYDIKDLDTDGRPLYRGAPFYLAEART